MKRGRSSNAMKHAQPFNQLMLLAVLVVSLLLIRTADAAGPQRQLLETKAIVPAAPSSFWDTGMRLCGLDEDGNCHNAEYALSVARFGFGGAAAAIVSLFVFVIFIPVRCLCNGFGGQNASRGVCPDLGDERKYSKNEIIATKVAVAAVIIPIIIGIGIGFRSNADISTSISTVTTSLVDSGDNILQSLVVTRDLLLTQPITASSGIIINTTVTTASGISNRMHDTRNTVEKYDNMREAIMIAGFAVTLALVVVGIICMILNLRVVALITGVVGLILLTLVWISFGVHMVADKFTYDVCVDVGILSNSSSNDTSVFKVGALASLWDCDNNTDFQQLANLVDSAIGYASNQTCQLRAQTCTDPNWVCSPTPPCGRDTLAIVIDSAHMTVIDSGQNRSVANCSQSCTSATYRNVSQTLVNIVGQYTNFTNVNNNTIQPLLKCQFAVDVVRGFDEPLCNDLFNSIYGVAISNLIVGIFYVAFIILMIMGFKRFESLSEAA